MLHLQLKKLVGDNFKITVMQLRDKRDVNDEKKCGHINSRIRNGHWF